MMMVSNVPVIEDVRRLEEVIGAAVHISNNDEGDLVDEIADRGTLVLIVDCVEDARGGLTGVFDG